jgi:hypothetical protein
MKVELRGTAGQTGELLTGETGKVGVVTLLRNIFLGLGYFLDMISA